MEKLNRIVQIGLLGLLILFSNSGRIGFGIGISFIIIAIVLINIKFNKSGYKFKDLLGENSINILKYLFIKDNKETKDEEDGYGDDITKRASISEKTKGYNDLISGKLTKKMAKITGILGLIPLLLILIFVGLAEFPEINNKTSININNLLSGDSTRIRITLAILVSFVIFKVVKAILDSKKQDKTNSFKS